MSGQQVSKRRSPRGHHPCAAPGCHELLAFHVFACRKHWARLPRELRLELLESLRAGDLEAYLALRTTAVAVLGRK